MKKPLSVTLLTRSQLFDLRSNHSRVVALAALIVVVSMSILFSVTACVQRASELKIVDLQGDLILRIDSTGSVFDDIDRKAAVINDREGTFTLLRDHQTIAFKNDPAVQRDKDRYIVKLYEESNIFEVKPDGAVLFNDKPWARVFGYTNADAQKNRFLAAIVIIPFIQKADILVALPRQVKNADHDRAIRRQPKISIPTDDEVYVGDERIPKADFDSQLGEKIAESLKRQPEANRIVNIASSISVEWGTIVHVINSARQKRADRIGLIVNGDLAKDRFLLQIPPLRDPNEDVSQLKINPLLLGVKLSSSLQVNLSTGGYEGIAMVGAVIPPPLPKGKPSPKGYEGIHSEDLGTLNDTSTLSQTLARIFQQRKGQHVYKPGMETRTDLSDDERVEKTVVIKAPRYLHYSDVIKLIDAVKGAGANPIVLQLDDLL